MGEVSTSKTGKHGHAKAHIVAIDIFTEKKYEDLCPTSHNLDVPFVKKVEMQAMGIEAGFVSVLLEDGSTREDIPMPTNVSVGEPTDTDKKLAKELEDELEKEGQATIVVTSACGIEKISTVKTVS